MSALEEEPRPALPQRELDKARGLGRAARAQGKAETACPFFLPQMREEWLRGFNEEGGKT